ncbi:MAG: DUF5132 domain-containing protein [Abditibacteriales bacterium]|nr:DUF5132 domain-containing protein [Abditibacteriales bacterium]MDW8366994.1 DUF5132 domain-containing protein [Abditibacteriales bacterium]
MEPEEVFEGIVRGLSRGMVLGLGVAGATILGPAVIDRLRPFARRVVGGYIAFSEKVKETIAESSERWQDLYAEAQAEYEASKRKQSETAENGNDPTAAATPSRSLVAGIAGACATLSAKVKAKVAEASEEWQKIYTEAQAEYAEKKLQGLSTADNRHKRESAVSPRQPRRPRPARKRNTPRTNSETQESETSS